jgi:hypothetical protein
MINYPPGVTESMIPGNRPEDQEIELKIVLTRGDIDDILNMDLECHSAIWNIFKDQIRDQYEHS